MTMRPSSPPIASSIANSDVRRSTFPPPMDSMQGDARRISTRVARSSYRPPPSSRPPSQRPERASVRPARSALAGHQSERFPVPRNFYAEPLHPVSVRAPRERKNVVWVDAPTAAHILNLPRWSAFAAVSVLPVVALLTWWTGSSAPMLLTARAKAAVAASAHSLVAAPRLARAIARKQAIESLFRVRSLSNESVPNKREAGKLAEELGLGTMAAAGKLLLGAPQQNWIKAAGDVTHTPGSLRWPVAEGRMGRGYGSGTGGYHLAVDIAGRRGLDVRAAAPGIVAYSDNRVRGYGNMVMLVHPGGWITLYAHHAVNRVVVGERVNAGTLIGQLGSTGISRGPHVHFELMYRGRNCDPMPLFQSYRHGTDSRLVQGPSVLWTDANERPRGVRCDARRKHPTYHH